MEEVEGKIPVAQEPILLRRILYFIHKKSLFYFSKIKSAFLP